MTENTEDPAADIAWMRRLAEEGADAPMQGASILMSAGLIYGAASLAHWAQIAGVVPVFGPVLGVSWLAATVVFLLTLTVILIRLKRRAGVYTAGNRASAAVWEAVGWGIFAFGSVLAVLGWRLGEGAIQVAFWLISPVILVFYGLGWAVTATAMKSRPLWGLAIGSFVAAPLLAALAGEVEQYLGNAAALFLLMALPGWLLMRSARR